MSIAANILIIDSAQDTLVCCQELLSASTGMTLMTCSGETAIQPSCSCQPDIILVERSALEAGRTKPPSTIRQHFPDAKIVILANADRLSGEEVHGLARRWDADALLGRPFDMIRLGAVMQALCPARTAAPAPVPDDSPAARIAMLTPREHDVLAGIVAGCSTKIIAYKLGISARTVEVHRASIMRQMGAKHVVHLVRAAIEAIQHGLYPPPPAAFAALLDDIYNFVAVSNPPPSGGLPCAPVPKGLPHDRARLHRWDDQTWIPSRKRS